MLVSGGSGVRTDPLDVLDSVAETDLPDVDCPGDRDREVWSQETVHFVHPLVGLR